MEIFTKIIAFLTNNPWGLIILSVLSGLLANLIFLLLKISYKKASKSYKHHKFVKYLTNSAIAHIYGQRSAKIMFGTVSQNVIWAVDIVLTMIRRISIIICLLVLLCIMLIILPAYLYWLPIIVISILITLKGKELKMYWDFFNMTEDKVFGEEYLKLEKEGYEKYWDKLVKEEKEETTSKSQKQQEQP